jgi:metal-responsive CopG/Arc/MetJ family transcriptional regulator
MGRKPLAKGESAGAVSITLPVSMHLKISNYCNEFNFNRSELVRLAMNNYFNEGNLVVYEG